MVKGSRHRFLIFPNIYISSTAKIGRVDNRLYAYGADEVHIPSGPHEVAIIIEKTTWILGSQSDPPGGAGESRVLVFKFETEAGHTYKVDIPL